MSGKKTIHVPDYIQGLIFDCDGTLVDSMPLHNKAWQHALEQAGAKWDFDFFNSKKGMKGKDIITLYNKQFGTSLDPVTVNHAKQEYFRLHRKDSKPIHSVLDVVLRYKDILPMAVASGSSCDNVLVQLEAIGVKNYFKVILTADDDVKPKPAPDIFLEAAKRIGIPPERCQVFEDGELGLEAARRAGMLATDVR